MRTFKLCLAIDLKAVVPDSVTAAWRADATGDEATPFLKNAQAMFPDDDEGFTLHILKHGTRACTRSSLRQLLESTGIGGTLSPVKAEVLDVSDTLSDVDVQPVLASQIDQALAFPDHLG